LRADAKFVGRLNADGTVDLVAPILRQRLTASGETNGWSFHVTTADRTDAVVIIAYDWRKRIFLRSLAVQVGRSPQERTADPKRVLEAVIKFGEASENIEFAQSNSLEVFGGSTR
jgi:hypothetical protein